MLNVGVERRSSRVSRDPLGARNPRTERNLGRDDLIIEATHAGLSRRTVAAAVGLSVGRIFASVLFALGRELLYVMAQLGHADPKMTLGIYARVMLDGEGAREQLAALVGDGGSVEVTPRSLPVTTA